MEIGERKISQNLYTNLHTYRHNHMHVRIEIVRVRGSSDISGGERPHNFEAVLLD